MTQPIIQCTDVDFSYKNGNVYTHVLSNVSITAYKGEIITLMGHSGCGKTTLLNILNGLEKPFNGLVTVTAHRPVTIFQDKRLIPWKTIAQNVKFGALEMNIPITDNNVDDILSNLGISPTIKEFYPKILSGGMSQRVAIARALICKPDVLFMDEPFSALDSETKTDLMFRIQNYVKDNNATGILITHNIKEASFLSSRIYHMLECPAKCSEIEITEFQCPYCNKE